VTLRTQFAHLAQATAAAPLIKLDRPDVLRGGGRPASLLSSTRSKIWQLAESLHCSIIGTCLSNAELRDVLMRLGVAGVEGADEHALHVLGVMLASRPEAGGKLLQKALDRRHGLSIKSFGRAKDEDALRLLWEDSAQRGDIPGAYWALLTHPAATEALVKKAFQHVHMLSHLVGAANRADIRRLRQLEEQNSALMEKVNRQQKQLRDGFTSRDGMIRQLNELLGRQLARSSEQATGPKVREEVATLTSVITDLNRRLGQETTRRQRLEQRLSALSAALKQMEAAFRRAEDERDAARADLEVFEDHMSGLLEPNGGNGRTLDLSGRTILYVGGRSHQIPQLRALVERTGARFLHHDGGKEQSASLLPGLVSRADVLYFPIDCVSHDAVATIKRLCRQLEKPYRPLRTASLAALMSMLALTDRDHVATSAAP
jgi:Uncharacterized protein conserved in bacteria (DUF2325)